MNIEEPKSLGLLRDLNARLNNAQRRQTALSTVEHISETMLQQESATLSTAGFETARARQQAELQAFADFKASKKKFQTDQLVDQILAQRSEEMGPLNNELLLIQSVEAMRELSPHYLNRFVSYVGALIRVESQGH